MLYIPVTVITHIPHSSASLFLTEDIQSPTLSFSFLAFCI